MLTSRAAARLKPIRPSPSRIFFASAPFASAVPGRAPLGSVLAPSTRLETLFFSPTSRLASLYFRTFESIGDALRATRSALRATRSALRAPRSALVHWFQIFFAVSSCALRPTAYASSTSVVWFILYTSWNENGFWVSFTLNLSLIHI